MRVGTRGSELALAQTNLVTAVLAEIFSDVVFEVRSLRTVGDAQGEQPRPGGAETPREGASSRLGDGIFVKEIQRALLSGEVDLAVHSLKDVPTDPVPGLVLAAIPQRQDPREALVGARLNALRPGQTVGTSSPRRIAQLRRLRPDLEILPVRGNVPSRIAKAARGDFTAVLVAAAGLNRLGIAADEVISAEKILPAPGQGALAVEAREDDSGLLGMLAAVHDPPTLVCVSAERRVLREMGGGCLLPVGAWGRIEGDRLLLDAAVTSSDGKVQIQEHAEGPSDGWFGMAKKVAGTLVSRGARKLLEEDA